jgi:uncharacterized membrane protein
MKATSKFTTKKIVLTALLAALTIVGSAIRVKVPADLTGTSAFHLGNIMCALSGILLGPWFGGMAAALGSALYDILLDPSYISECWITFLTKGAYGIAAGLVIRCGSQNWGYVKAILATVAGALTYAALYLMKSYFYSGLLVGGLTPAAAWVNVLYKIPATTFNAVVAIVAAPVLAIAIQKALKKSHISI